MSRILSIMFKQICPFSRSFTCAKIFIKDPFGVSPLFRNSKFNFSSKENKGTSQSDIKNDYKKNLDEKKEGGNDTNEKNVKNVQKEETEDKENAHSNESKKSDDDKNSKDKVDSKEKKLENDNKDKDMEKEPSKKLSEVEELKNQVEKLQNEASEWKQEKLYLIAENANQIKRITQ